MKVRNRLTRAAAFMLTLAMLLSLLPAQVLAVNEVDDTFFKNISLFSAVTSRPISISYNMDATRQPADYLPRNYLYTPTTVSRDDDCVNPLEWMLIAFSIQYSQDVDLELYRLNEGAAEWEDQLPIEPETMITRYDSDPDAIENFLGERLGYLKVYPYTGNYEGPDDGGFYTYIPYTRDDLFAHVNRVVNGDDSSATELKEYRAIGFLGQPLIHQGVIDPQSEEAAGDDVLDEDTANPPAEDTTEPKESETESEAQPEEAEANAESEAENGNEPEAAEQALTREEVSFSLSENDEEASGPEASDDITDEENDSGTDESSDDADEPAEADAEDTRTDSEPEEDTAEDENTIAGNDDSSGKADEPDEPDEPEVFPEVPPEPVLYADAPSGDGKIQNFSVWGGELSDNL